jgi:hypothetical protein
MYIILALNNFQTSEFKITSLPMQSSNFITSNSRNASLTTRESHDAPQSVAQYSYPAHHPQAETEAQADYLRNKNKNNVGASWWSNSSGSTELIDSHREYHNVIRIII